MFLKILLLKWTVHLVILEVESSLVVDSLSQKGIHISDYCPVGPHCAEGAHVMCMYYNPKRVYGPSCQDPRNVSITPELVNKLLEVTNAIRAKLSTGVETGKGKEPLPRAFGMFKLQWDNELATFAQVLANQCVIRHDMCRSTKRFRSPGQTVGLIRFTIPDWMPVRTKKKYFDQPGLTEAKVAFAVQKALEAWYNTKLFVTPAMIIEYPDWSLNPKKDNGKLYMDLVHSTSTHMGCGISAYKDYAFQDNRSPLNYNNMLVICNFSEQPKKGKSVYDLEPDMETSRCGCPPNAVEDEDCLCSYVEDQPSKENCDGVNCEQSVILLPIFTVEDAPPSKLTGRQGSNAMVSRPTDSMEILGADFSENGAKKEHSIAKVLDGIINGRRIDIPAAQRPRANITIDKKKLDKPAANLNHRQSPPASASHVQQKEANMFSRSATIGTPKANNPLKLTFKDFKKDVVPRKDFSQAKHLLNNYIESAKNFSNIQYKPHVSESQERISNKLLSATETLNNVEENVMVHNYDNDTLHSKHDVIIYGHEHESDHEHDRELNHEDDRDEKLMTLLDKLEEEVQHIELTGNKKELFDAKIRKIYDSVVGKQSGLPLLKTTHHPQLETVVNGVIEKFIDHDHNKETIHENIDDKLYDDIGKTIDDIVHNHNDESHRTTLNEDTDGPKSRHLRQKSRMYEPYNSERGIESDGLLTRDNAITNFHTDNLINGYRDSGKDYKPYRIPEHRQSYKNHEHSYENFRMSRYSGDEGIKRDKRLKHTRDYYKSRNTNSVENYKNRYDWRHQVTDDTEYDLSPDRKKYYQERLDNLERRLHGTRSRKYRNEENEHPRRALRLRSSDDEALRRPSMNRLDHFDRRGRSRSIHRY